LSILLVEVFVCLPRVQPAAGMGRRRSNSLISVSYSSHTLCMAVTAGFCHSVLQRATSRRL
jgi:hypothetical protein